MMNVYLVQHAENRSKEEDASRPLSEVGISNADKTARFLTEQAGISVGSIVHSGKTRAQQTAEILANYLKPPGGIAPAEGLEPLADPGIWEERLKTYASDVMIVGHLPHLSKLAARLLCEDEARQVVGFKYAGVVCLYRGEEGDWSVAWMVVPQIL